MLNFFSPLEEVGGGNVRLNFTNQDEVRYVLEDADINHLQRELKTGSFSFGKENFVVGERAKIEHLRGMLLGVGFTEAA